MYNSLQYYTYVYKFIFVSYRIKHEVVCSVLKHKRVEYPETINIIHSDENLYRN